MVVADELYEARPTLMLRHVGAVELDRLALEITWIEFRQDHEKRHARDRQSDEERLARRPFGITAEVGFEQRILFHGARVIEPRDQDGSGGPPPFSGR